MGYTKDVPSIYQAAGIQFDFSDDYVKELASFVYDQWKTSMRIIGYFLVVMSLLAARSDDVVFTPDEAIYFVSPDTTSITRTVNDNRGDAYFSLDSVIDSVCKYQIDTSNQPPINLS